MKQKRYMKPHLIDVTFVAEDLTASVAGLMAAQDNLSGGLKVLEDSQRKRVQYLGTRNETFSLAAMELARQYPQIVPPGIDMAALERDITARNQLLPVLLRSRQFTRLLEDTVAMLGVDLYNGGRGIYKSAQVVGDLYGLSAEVEELGQHFARGSRTPSEPDPEPLAPMGTV